MGISQLDRAGEGLKRRREIADAYDKAFAGLSEIEILSGSNQKLLSVGVGHAYHLYIIRTKRRKELYDYLHHNDIFAQVHYIPVHLAPYYRSLGSKKGDMPMAEQYYEECLSLPMYPSLKEKEQEFVIKTVKQFFGA